MFKRFVQCESYGVTRFNPYEFLLSVFRSLVPFIPSCYSILIFCYLRVTTTTKSGHAYIICWHLAGIEPRPQWWKASALTTGRHPSSPVFLSCPQLALELWKVIQNFPKWERYDVCHSKYAFIIWTRVFYWELNHS